jgi:hypothetical protein
MTNCRSGIDELISARMTKKRPGDERGLVGDRGVRERAGEIGVLGDRGDDGHEVRLTGAVVADDQEPLVVGWRLSN